MEDGFISLQALMFWFLYFSLCSLVLLVLHLRLDGIL